MKKTYAFLLALVSCAFWYGCTSDDNQEVSETVPVVRFTAFSNTGEDIVQMNGRTDREEPEVIGLSEEFNLEFFEEASQQIDSESIAYYTWEVQDSRAYYKDLETGSIFFAEDLCGFRLENEFPKIIRAMGGNREFVILIYAGLPLFAAPETRIRIFRKSNGQCEDLLLPEAGQNGIIDFLLNDHILAVAFESDFTEDASLTLIDLETANLLTTLPLDDNFKSASFREQDLLFFQQDQTYKSFNTATLAFTTEGATPGLPVLSPGFFSTRYSGDQVAVRYIYQQPSLFFAQPAVYDLASGNLVNGGEPFLPLLQNRIEQEVGDRVIFGNFDMDLDSGLILISYVKGDGTPNGGLILTDFDATPLQILPLPFVPERLILREIIRP